MLVIDGCEVRGQFVQVDAGVVGQQRRGVVGRYFEDQNGGISVCRRRDQRSTSVDDLGSVFEARKLTASALETRGVTGGCDVRDRVRPVGVGASSERSSARGVVVEAVIRGLLPSVSFPSAQEPATRSAAARSAARARRAECPLTESSSSRAPNARNRIRLAAGR